MSKLTLGAALVLTTATVATSVVVNPTVARADDTVVADKNAELYTIYGPNGVEKMSWEDLHDDNGVVYPNFGKLRDFEYSRISTDGIWYIGPNGEHYYNPNAVKPQTTTQTTTTQSSTEPPTQTTPATTEPAKQVIEQIRIVKFKTEYQADETVKLGDQVLVREGRDGRELVETFADGTPQKVTVLEGVVNAVYKVNPSDERLGNKVTPKDTTTTKPVDKTEDKSLTKPSTKTTETKSSAQTTTTTPTKGKEEIKTLPKAGDASILSMLAGAGILSGFGLTGLKRKFKK